MVEAGYSSYVLVDILEDLGVEVKVAHPLEVKAIAKAKIKTDKRDSRMLADMLRANLIPEAHNRSPESPAGFAAKSFFRSSHDAGQE